MMTQGDLAEESQESVPFPAHVSLCGASEDTRYHLRPNAAGVQQAV